MAKHFIFFSLTLIFLYYLKQAEGSQSIWEIRVDSNTSHTATIFPNYLYKNSYVAARILCSVSSSEVSPKEETQIVVTWIFRQVSCMEEMYKPNLKEYTGLMALDGDRRESLNETRLNATRNIIANTTKLPPVAFQISSNKLYTCGRNNIIELLNESDRPYKKIVTSEETGEQRVIPMKRDAKVNQLAKDVVVSAWEDGMYHFQLAIVPARPTQFYKARVTVEMHGSYGYLSAIEWPLLPYNGVMAFLYLILSTVWIMVWARSHRFTLKIHVAMGLVAVAGAMSTTLMFVQNAAENSISGGVPLIMWFARILSVLQLACLNLVLMIVSTGYGISVPTLPRSSLIKMAAVCVLQFLVGVTWFICTDATLLVQYAYPTFTKVTLWLKVAIFSIIAAWIMVSSIKTLVHLRQRRHAGMKLVTFTIFMATCIIAFITHLTVFGLSLGWMQACRKYWQLQWVFSAVTHMEAFILLIVLMILWRPVDTAQSYAFAPLGMDNVADDSEEEEEDSETELYTKETDKIKLDEL